MTNGNFEKNNFGNIFLDDNALGMVKQAIDFMNKPYESETSKDRPIWYYWRGISNEDGYERIPRKSKWSEFRTAFDYQMRLKVAELYGGKSIANKLEKFINERKYEIKKIRESIYQVGDNVLKCVERDDFKQMNNRTEHPGNTLAIAIVKTLREVTEYLYFCNDVDHVLSYYVNAWYMSQADKAKPEEKELWLPFTKRDYWYRQYGNLKWALNYYEGKGLSKLLQGYQTLKIFYTVVPNKMSAFWDYLSDYVYMVQIEKWKFNWSKVPLYLGTIALGFAFAELIIRISRGTNPKKRK